MQLREIGISRFIEISQRTEMKNVRNLLQVQAPLLSECSLLRVSNRLERGTHEEGILLFRPFPT